MIRDKWLSLEQHHSQKSPVWRNDRFISVFVITTCTFCPAGAALLNNLSPHALSCGCSDVLSQQAEAARWEDKELLIPKMLFVYMHILSSSCNCSHVQCRGRQLRLSCSHSQVIWPLIVPSLIGKLIFRPLIWGGCVCVLLIFIIVCAVCG